MNSIMCRLGFHSYEYYDSYFIFLGGATVYERCSRCKKEKYIMVSDEHPDTLDYKDWHDKRLAEMHPHIFSYPKKEGEG